MSHEQDVHINSNTAVDVEADPNQHQKQEGFEESGFIDSKIPPNHDSNTHQRMNNEDYISESNRINADIQQGQQDNSIIQEESIEVEQKESSESKKEQARQLELASITAQLFPKSIYEQQQQQQQQYQQNSESDYPRFRHASSSVNEDVYSNNLPQAESMQDQKGIRLNDIEQVESDESNESSKSEPEEVIEQSKKNYSFNIPTSNIANNDPHSTNEQTEKAIILHDEFPSAIPEIQSVALAAALSAEAQQEINFDPISFESRRTRYRYIKCWEDNRVQLIGILTTMIENISTQAIAIATSSSSSNYRVVRYFKEKAQQLLQYSAMQVTSIGSLGGEYFSKLNTILTQINSLTQSRMASSKQLADFIQTNIVADILTADALKYESRLTRYKDLTAVSTKRIQKIGRQMAEEYQEYSSIFSSIARTDLRCAPKKRSELRRVFARKDLCYNEWLFLSEVFEHFEHVKVFGIDTQKFLRELHELEKDRVNGIKKALRLYLKKHEELIAKIAFTPEYASPGASQFLGNHPTMSTFLPIPSIPSSVRGSLRIPNTSPGNNFNLSQITSQTSRRSPQHQARKSYNNFTIQATSGNITRDFYQDSFSNSKQSKLSYPSSPRSNSNYPKPSSAAKELIELQCLPKPKAYQQRDSLTFVGGMPNNIAQFSQSNNNNNSLNSSVILAQQNQQMQQLPPGLTMNSSLLIAPICEERTCDDILSGLYETSVEGEVDVYFALRNLIPVEEQHYLRKINDLENDCEVSLEVFTHFLETFSLKSLKQSPLILSEFKAKFTQLSEKSPKPKDVLVIVTLDKNLIIVETLTSQFIKKPVCFVKGYRSSYTNEGVTSVLIKEINNVFFRTSNKYSLVFDFPADRTNFLASVTQAK